MGNNNLQINTLNIEMQQPSIQVTIQLNMNFSLSGKTIEEVEAGFKKAFEEACCGSMEKYLEERDKTINLEESSSKNRQISRIYQKRSLKLSYGEINFPCRQIKDNNGYSIPLLMELGLPDKKRIVTSSYDSIYSRCACSTFRKTQEGIKNPMSLGSLHQEFQKEIGKQREDEMSGLQYLNDIEYYSPAPVSEIARVMDDGIFIRERTLEGRSKGQKQKKRGHLEVQITRCDFAKKEDVNNNENYWTYPPYVYASIEPAKKHIEQGRIYLDAHTGLSRSKNVIHISDAKANGKRHCKEYNPNSVWQLDWYHLFRHVSILGKIDEKWKKDVWELIEVERLDDAISLIKDGLSKMKKFEPPISVCDDEKLQNLNKKNKKWWEKKIEEVDDLIKYLKNNSEGIYGVRSLVGVIPGEHLPFGSGPMERINSVIVAHRMKGHGKTWKKESASNMVWLINREFQKNPENSLIKEASKEAHWWSALQEKPLMSSFDLRRPGARNKNKNNNVNESLYKTTQGSFPVVNRGLKSVHCYDALKGIGSGKDLLDYCFI
jgi:hypothetical protein